TQPRPVPPTASQADTDIDQADGAEETVPTNDPAEGAEAIVVTGIRQSLRTSQEIKRNSEVVVDSITAEDIGALPDRSVTEALQRVPGVSINRFAASVDPDHFSVEGSGVVVRGLTYVRSELNGRDTFTANNGRGLSFADVPAELMGGVDVFKSPSADMIEGGIAGTVNLRTRVPFDSQGFVLAGSLEGSWGDMARDLTPTVSVLASNRWETGAGEFGLLGSFVYSQLRSRADAVQISNFGRRTLFTNGNVVGGGGATPVGGAACTTGAEPSCVYFPRGAVMRSQEFDRQRYGYSAAAQWRSPNRDILATLQFLRSDARQAWTEHAIEIATDVVTSAGDSRAAPGTTLEFDDSGLFDRGVITGPTGWRADILESPSWSCGTVETANCRPSNVRTPRFGLQSNNQRRDVDQRNVTSDYGANVRWNPSERLTLNFDYHHTDSTVENLDATLWASSYQNVAIDMNGTRIPSIQFLPPEVCVGPARNSNCAGVETSVPPNYFRVPSFSDPSNSFYRASMDHIEESEGNEDAFRVDANYDFRGDLDWLRSIRVGYRFADRDNVARFSTYNWGVLSEQWGNNGPVWLDDPVDGVQGGRGGAPMGGMEVFSFPRFMRGRAGDPTGGDPRLFYAQNITRNYQQYVDYSRRIVSEWFPVGHVPTGGSTGWVPLAARPGVVEGTPFLPGEINPINERNNAGYVMLRFDDEIGNGRRVTGNIGLRYTQTRRTASGFMVFNRGNFTPEEICLNPPAPPPGQPAPQPTPFCRLPAEVRAQARAFASGAIIPNDATLTYDYFLPSLNIRAEMGGGLQFRFAWYNGISPPEFGLTRNFFNINLLANEEDIRAGGGRPIGRFNVGNPFLRPIEATNFDLSAEWYFDDVGQLSIAAFYKRLSNVLTNGTVRQSFTNNGATFEAIVTTPINSDETGEIRGFEIAYQQTYDFLPGLLGGFGLSATYTFVDSSGVPQSTLSATDPDVGSGRVANVDTGLLPLQGLSRHTINFTPFYEYGPLSIRLAYNWRSRFLLTVRDVIVPFAPIYGEATGQLDGSIFYSINDNIRIGVQGVNLLNEVTRTSQVLEASEDGILRAPRSWFMNDRRFTGIVRVNF
nr:TonB-dependent receptor [Pseudomonadota bacterium]